MASDLLAYFVALFFNWIGLISGIVGVGLLVWEKFFKKYDLNPKRYLAIFAVCVLVSGFIAWRDQLNAAHKADETIASLNKQLEVALDQSKPKLDGHIYAAWLSETDQNSVDVFLLLTIRNQGAPSIARGWYLSVMAPGMPHESYGELTHYSGAKMAFYEPACNCDYIFDSDAALYLRVGEDPIPRGAERSGYVTRSSFLA